ncbi:hypothetical protein KCP71_15525 [Salmonella enterica subsp. enterica]|nr:hypothetical protein KCP71_15525 [Salmonella enterica subsp. enterica]
MRNNEALPAFLPVKVLAKPQAVGKIPTGRYRFFPFGLPTAAGRGCQRNSEQQSVFPGARTTPGHPCCKALTTRWDVESRR